MDFSANKLPSSMREIDWHWRHNIQERFDLSRINIDGKTVRSSRTRDSEYSGLMRFIHVPSSNEKEQPVSARTAPESSCTWLFI